MTNNGPSLRRPRCGYCNTYLPNPSQDECKECGADLRAPGPREFRLGFLREYDPLTDHSQSPAEEACLEAYAAQQSAVLRGLATEQARTLHNVLRHKLAFEHCDIQRCAEFQSDPWPTLEQQTIKQLRAERDDLQERNAALRTEIEGLNIWRQEGPELVKERDDLKRNYDGVCLRANTEAQLACDLRASQDQVIERCAQAVERLANDTYADAEGAAAKNAFQYAAKQLRAHIDGISGEDWGELTRRAEKAEQELATLREKVKE